MPSVMPSLASASRCPPPPCPAAGRRVRQASVLGGLCLALAACSLALDWRQVRPEGWGAALLMPCRPDQHERPLLLAGNTVKMGMLVCEADGQTFALSSAEVADPTQVGPALQALADAARANLKAPISAPAAMQVKGMTPHPLAGRWAWRGQLPDGRPVLAQVMLFSRGSRVYQATLIGPHVDPALAQTFFDAIELSP